MTCHTEKHELQAPAMELRDRLLAYLYQLDINPVESLEIAVKTLEGQEAANRPLAFEKLFAILAERGLNREDDAEFALAAEKMAPPLNRRPMLSGGLNISLRDFMARLLTGGVRPLKEKGR